MAEIHKTEDGGSIWLLSKEETIEMRCIFSDSQQTRERVNMDNTRDGLFTHWVKMRLDKLLFRYSAVMKHKQLEGKDYLTF